MSDNQPQRRSRTDITPERLRALQTGQAATTNLVEMLAIDMAVLLRCCAPAIPGDVAAVIAAYPITRRMMAGGAALYEYYGAATFGKFVLHASDTMRGLAAYATARHYPRLADAVSAMQALADDAHFGVREWAWLALRGAIATDIDEALMLLQPWACHQSVNLRRFACESTRPRGVWCCHIPILKAEPWRAEPLLQPLLTDKHRYVQDSVANWLNDAAKTQPDWVNSQLAAVSEISPYVVRRALRSVR